MDAGSLGSVPIDSVADGEIQILLRVLSDTGAVFEDRVLQFLDRFELTAPQWNSR